MTIAVGLLVFHMIGEAKEWGSAQILFYIAFGLLLSSLVIKWVALKIVWLWMKLAEGLGYVNGRIFLSIVFFIFLTPLAFLYRIFNKDSLQLKKKEASYYSERNHQYTPRDIEKPW